MDFLELANKRHSYRGAFKDTPVTREQLKAIMEAGRLAPSGCNKATTSFIALDNKELIENISNILSLPFIATAPAAILVLTAPFAVDKGTSYHVQNYSAAILSMLFAVSSMDLASVWIEGQVVSDNKAEHIKALVNVPGDISIVAVLPIGVPAAKKSQPKKPAFEELAFFNGYPQQ